MKNRPSIYMILLIITCWLLNDATQNGNAQETASLNSGMLLQLRHDRNLPLTENTGWPRMFGGDIGMPPGMGFSFTLLTNQNPKTTPPGSTFQNSELPAGVVFWLKHSINNKGDLRYLRHDPVANDKLTSMVATPTGVDLGAPNGQGFFWYETVGDDFQPKNREAVISRLPKGTVVGLKNTVNQPTKTLSIDHWGRDKFGNPFDPQKSFIRPGTFPSPAHFEPRFGGDMGADANTGFFWYEKIDGFVPEMPDLVSELHPALSADLSRVTWNLTIKNLGKAAASGPFSVSMEVGNSANPQFPSGRVFIVTDVGNGKSIDIPNPIQTSFFSCPSHKYQVVINVDSGHVIDESDEANNLFIDNNFCVER